MGPRKIAFVTPGTFPLPSANSSSVERVVENIVPLLDRQYVTARIYGRIGRKLRRKGKVDGVSCERFPAADKTRYVNAVARSVRKFRPDIIEVENRPVYALRLKKNFPKSRIWLNLHSSTFTGSKYINKSTLRRSFKAADRIIVNSEFLRDSVADKVPEAADKLRVIHLGVDTGRFLSQYSNEGSEKRQSLRKARGWQGRSVVIFMGRLIPRKGVHHLLRILPELAKAHPSVLLVIVGSAYYGSHRVTSYTRKLFRLAKASPGHVKFVPYVSYPEVPGWFLAADVAVVPSGKGEAFGLVNVEAMACGLPVVATRSGGMKEIIEDGVTGYLVSQSSPALEIKEKLLQLLADELLRKEMGVKSRERVEQLFTWQRSAERWIELLREFEG